MSLVFWLAHLNLLHFTIVGKSISVVHIAVFQVFAIGHNHRLNHSGNAILFGFVLIRNRQSLALYVGLDPEVWEEDEEKHAVEQDEMNEEGNLEFTLFHEVILRDMDSHQYKLNLWKIRRKKM